jgi:hypothetical protein
MSLKSRKYLAGIQCEVFRPKSNLQLFYIVNYFILVPYGLNHTGHVSNKPLDRILLKILNLLLS